MCRSFLSISIIAIQPSDAAHNDFSEMFLTGIDRSSSATGRARRSSQGLKRRRPHGLRTL
jgi:hypothetical protein